MLKSVVQFSIDDPVCSSNHSWARDNLSSCATRQRNRALGARKSLKMLMVSVAKRSSHNEYIDTTLWPEKMGMLHWRAPR